MSADAEGDLVAARSGYGHGSAVHASELLHAPARPDLGLTPWNPLCHTTWTLQRCPGEAVTCRTCLRVMERRGLTQAERTDHA